VENCRWLLETVRWAVRRKNGARRDSNPPPGFREGRAEVDFFAAQTDAPATGDQDGFAVERIIDVRQPLR
jgi:hypothetical protein